MSRILMIFTADHPAPESAEAEVVALTAPGLPAGLVSAHDWTLADLAVLAAGQGAANQGAAAEGYAAVCVADPGDYGANALRSVLDVPVVGAGRSALFYALTLGACFGVLAPAGGYTRAKKLVQEYGLAAQCTGVRRIGEGEDAILTAARAAITEDGAEVLVLWQPLEAAATARLAAELPVPLIEPASLSLRLAEAFLGLGLAQSRRTWPMPQVAKPDLIAALVAAGAGA
ncbi:MAG: hydantoin racemase [Tistrella sp.]|uniref:Hydantoin racemase n=1 Tax=Tistrella mobilis TaxID=171437 RepID=A0A3B9IW19_9PROT|nr:aspartate/glutamate racemase family protein [Tistrella sp.]MAD35552.1 hydantoin racemase [Tistrella sp.]MBA74050.1 hydantoin racemase [Tistrella sp.]HAE51429.1 hydantoin racemase [Tistrella mobilis]